MEGTWGPTCHPFGDAFPDHPEASSLRCPLSRHPVHSSATCCNSRTHVLAFSLSGSQTRLSSLWGQGLARRVPSLPLSMGSV